MMKVGYALVSSFDHDRSIQINALQQAGCKQIITDQIDSAGKEYTGLETALSLMKEGDILVVWRLALLGRSLKQIVDFVNQLRQKRLGIQSLQESLDTSANDGHLILQIFAILAETERELVRERTRKGLQTARARGRKGGRPKGLSEHAKRIAEIAESLYLEREMTISEICVELSISKPTLYSYLRYQGVKIGESPFG
jgi:DNA invertase Pin-like site-specific DNA recombinase